MFSQLPCATTRRIGIIKDLTNTIASSNHLDNPQKTPSLHHSGTNGKGSTSHMLASILQEGI
jgi:dihydrofolate synthase/folylpolyglutamate synthase